MSTLKMFEPILRAFMFLLSSSQSQKTIRAPLTTPSAMPLPRHGSPVSEKMVSISLSVAATEEDRNRILSNLTQATSSPGLRIDTNNFRGCPSLESKITFRNSLLHALRSKWNDPEVEVKFLQMVDVLESQGCAVFAGLIEAKNFEGLIKDFTKAMDSGGSQAFLHCFMNLADYPKFLRNGLYNHVFVHPLLIALMSYMMGGPVRMTDVRGKDTQPISINAQDNMLHVDNTPFREEYKVLVGWEKGLVRGPTGQNFTYLPGTHKGNRHIRVDKDGLPWSTENESIFLTDIAIDNVFELQKKVTGQGPTVVEVSYPSQPISAVFNAGSLVHHRYRNSAGHPRSCIIAAFHLCADNPGALLNTLSAKPSCLSDFVFGHQDGASREQFLHLLLKESTLLKTKILNISDQAHPSTLIDSENLKLNDEKLFTWKNTVINAPSTTSIKLGGNNLLYHPGKTISRALLIKKLSDVMWYDKHGLLDLILYADGHEEARKSARKLVWSMDRNDIVTGLDPWLPAIIGHTFSSLDITQPDLLDEAANAVVGLVCDELDVELNLGREPSDQHCIMLRAFRQLLVDLGESIMRCEKIETYITTNLFIFWTINRALPSLNLRARTEAILMAVVFLKAYIAAVLLVEQD